MGGMIMWLLKLFGGLDLKGIIEQGVNAYAAKQDAGVKHDQIASDLVAKETELSVREAQLNANIVIAEQGNWLTRMARPLIAFPFIAYAWKVVLWDNVVMADWVNGVTHSLSSAMAAIMGTVFGSYFIGRTIEKTVSVVRNRLSQ